MEKISYEEFVKKELKRWADDAAEGKELPSVVNRLLTGGYKNYVKTSEEEKRVGEEFEEKMNNNLFR